MIWDDQNVIVNVKDKGLVIVSGCSHAGAVNVLRNAQRLTGSSRIAGFIGGFHLTGGLFEPIIEPTVDAFAPRSRPCPSRPLHRLEGSPPPRASDARRLRPARRRDRRQLLRPVAATVRSVELRAVAQAIADALPADAEEVVLTGSVSRGVADDVSDIEMLVVTRERARPRGVLRARRASRARPTSGRGARRGADQARVRLPRWRPDRADLVVARARRGGGRRGVRRRSVGDRGRARATASRCARRSARPMAGAAGDYPDELARPRIEDAALTWGGFAAAGLLTLSGRATARARRADGRRRVARRAHRVRDEPRLAADAQAPRGSSGRAGASSPSGWPSGSRRR